MNAAMSVPNSPRKLPSNDPATIASLTNQILEEQYVTFILYCNPSLPENLSTTELRRGFRAVPRSDGKAFEALAVFRLVGKLEKGEIPTWIALVTELGVEPPDVAKGGSTQKLQQYGVRLKRWAHAYHIDAFFQYLLGNSHSYFTHIPQGPDGILVPRDGVSAEEDLALRALLPGLRPKRGRRKGYEEDAESIDTPNKRLRAGTPSTVDGRNSPRPDLWGRISQSPAPSFIPQPPNPHMAQLLAASPRPQAQPVYTHDEHLSDLFSAAARALGGDNIQPAPTSAMPANTPHLQHMNAWPIAHTRSHDEYPQSAIDIHPPGNVFGSPDLNDGSRSAHPLAGSHNRASRAKKRATSAISASWNTPLSDQIQAGTSRPRGRPPSKQTTKKGSLETWSVKQSIEADRENQPTFFSNGDARQIQAPSPIQPQQSAVEALANSTARRIPTQKLSLTVPHQPGGNVRLATPPVAREAARAAAPVTSSIPRMTLNDDPRSHPRSSASRTREHESERGRDRDTSRQRHRLYADDRAERTQRRTSAEFFNTIDEEGSQQEEFEVDDETMFDDNMSNDNTNGKAVNWKQRAHVLARRLKAAQDELRRVKKAVLEAVM